MNIREFYNIYNNGALYNGVVRGFRDIKRFSSWGKLFILHAYTASNKFQSLK